MSALSVVVVAGTRTRRVRRGRRVRHGRAPPPSRGRRAPRGRDASPRERPGSPAPAARVSPRLSCGPSPRSEAPGRAGTPASCASSRRARRRRRRPRSARPGGPRTLARSARERPGFRAEPAHSGARRRRRNGGRVAVPRDDWRERRGRRGRRRRTSSRFRRSLGGTASARREGARPRTCSPSSFRVRRIRRGARRACRG